MEDFTQLSRERLEHTFNVNIIGMIRLAQEVVEHMPAGGSIINVSPVWHRGAHCAAKSGNKEATLTATVPGLSSLAALRSRLAVLGHALADVYRSGPLRNESQWYLGPLPYACCAAHVYGSKPGAECGAEIFDTGYVLPLSGCSNQTLLP